MKNLNFIVNRICANTPPYCSKRASRYVWMLVLMLTLGVGQMWGADGDTAYELTFTKLTSGTNISSYTAAHDLTVSSKNWSVVGNQSLGEYLGVGGKNIEDEDRTLTCTSSIDKVIKEVKVNYSGIQDGTGITLTVNSAKLEVSSNSSFTSIIETVNVNNLNLTASCSASHISFTPSGSPWASGKYYRISINCTTVTTSGTKNSHFDITSVQFIEGSTATLSSIAITTPPTKLAYVAGETFSATGAVVTATMSNSTSKDVTSSATWNKTTLTTSDAQVTASYTEGTITRTADQAINVYSVTISMVGEDETTVLTGEGIPSAPTRNGATLGVDNTTLYKFKRWVISGASLNTEGTYTSTKQASEIVSPTGNVTLKAVYYAPRTVTWMVNGHEYTPGDNGGTNGTAAVQYSKAWNTLTLPTDPTPTCGNKFMGWTTVNIGSNAYDGEISELDLMDSSNKSSKTGGGHNINNNITFYAVFADYAE